MSQNVTRKNRNDLHYRVDVAIELEPVNAVIRGFIERTMCAKWVSVETLRPNVHTIHPICPK